MLMNERVWKDFIRFFVVKVAPFATSILSLYFLASSSPNKGDVFESEVFVCINPLALRALPLYFAAQNTPQCYGTRQRRRVRCISLSLLSDSICDTPQYYGARQGRG